MQDETQRNAYTSSVPSVPDVPPQPTTPRYEIEGVGIRVPLAESEYDRSLSDRAYAKARLDELYEDFPDVFPEAFPWGYAFYGFTDLSIKQEIRCRRIRLDQGQTVFEIAPAFVMPYMTGRTQEVVMPCS